MDGRFGKREKQGSQNIHINVRKIEKRKRKRKIESGKERINRIAYAGKRVDIMKRNRKSFTH